MMGSWTLYVLPGFAVEAGILGAITYALAEGGVVLTAAYIGTILRRKMPGIVSLSDYTYKRYGR
jgi:Na+/proline symporter